LSYPAVSNGILHDTVNKIAEPLLFFEDSSMTIAHLYIAARVYQLFISGFNPIDAIIKEKRVSYYIDRCPTTAPVTAKAGTSM
jgi:hypothetical protein